MFEKVLVKFNFPDTVYRNKSYNGLINYESVLDTTTNVMEKANGIDRYIVYGLRKTKTIDYEFKKLKKVRLDTFGAVNNRAIPFFDIIFTEAGTFYLDGVINEHVTVDTLQRPKKPTDKVRYIENEVRATHKVIVIDEPKSDIKPRLNNNRAILEE